MASSNKISISQADSIDIDVVVAGPAGPIDLTGATIEWALAKQENGPALVRKSIDAGIELMDAPAGKIRISVVPSETAALAGDYFHRLRVALPNGDAKTVARAFLTVLPSIPAAT